MNFDKYTIKSQEVLQKAAEVATGNNQQAIEPGHLLKAALITDENVVSFLVKKLNVNRAFLDAKPKEGSFGDEFIAVEQLRRMFMLERSTNRQTK